MFNLKEYINKNEEIYNGLKEIVLLEKGPHKLNERVTLFGHKRIEFDPFNRALYNHRFFTDEELNRLNFLTQPMFMSMN